MNKHTSRPKVALITGANKGIGRAVAELLAAQKVTVLVGARDARRGEETAAAVSSPREATHTRSNWTSPTPITRFGVAACGAGGG
ncbi:MULTISPECIES: SDR family NAD(P)-dependent oxidoreductase [unclassified Nonomuraea]|uniref:SDR family NAD(P)-dependent oxidoreductase n=1 Tax=unclassified Nonomuraea TaxID=2593643 RepID=UPI0033E36CE6